MGRDLILLSHLLEDVPRTLSKTVQKRGTGCRHRRLRGWGFHGNQGGAPTVHPAVVCSDFETLFLLGATG